MGKFKLTSGNYSMISWLNLFNLSRVLLQRFENSTPNISNLLSLSTSDIYSPFIVVFKFSDIVVQFFFSFAIALSEISFCGLFTRQSIYVPSKAL